MLVISCLHFYTPLLRVAYKNIPTSINLGDTLCSIFNSHILHPLHQRHRYLDKTFKNLHIRRRHHPHHHSSNNRPTPKTCTKRPHTTSFLPPQKQSRTKPDQNHLHNILPTNSSKYHTIIQQHTTQTRTNY